MKTVPTKQSLAKAERIFHDMEGALWKLYEIFGYNETKEVYQQIHQISSMLWNIRRNTLEKYADLKCRYCGKPVFTPIYISYEDEGLKPFHKRCAYKKQQWEIQNKKAKLNSIDNEGL